MKQLAPLFVLTVLSLILFTACSTMNQNSSDSYSSEPTTSSEPPASSWPVISNIPIGSSNTAISSISTARSTSSYSEIIATIESTHEGLSRIDLTAEEIGYGVDLYFEPMEWDTFDNEKRVELAKAALEYALTIARENTHDVVVYAGYTANGEMIFYNDSSFHIVVTDTDGSNIHGTGIWP